MCDLGLLGTTTKYLLVWWDGAGGAGGSWCRYQSVDWSGMGQHYSGVCRVRGGPELHKVGNLRTKFPEYIFPFYAP